MEKQQLIRNHFHIYSRIIYRGKIRAGLIQLTVSGPHITMKVVVILSLKKKKSPFRKILLIWTAPSLCSFQYHRNMWR